MDKKKLALIVYDPQITPDKHGYLEFSIHIHKVILCDSLSELRAYEDNYRQTHYHCVRTQNIIEAEVDDGC